MKHLKGIVFSFFVLALLGACSSDDSVEEEIKNRPTAEELYQTAQENFDDKKYSEAIENFQKIEKEYPFSPLATRSQIMSAYSYYKDESYDDAIGVLESFVKLHPGNEEIEYAYYLRALCYYERIADVKRDQDITKKALDALNDVVTRFPDTDYARDSKLKLDLATDHLAGKEMEIGRFYQKKGQYIAAINRFKTVVKDYDTTTHVAEALYRLTEVYLTIGVEEEARRNAAVLGHNYPDTKWYQYAYRLVAGGSDSPLPEKKSSPPSWMPKVFGGYGEESEDNEPVEEPVENIEEKEESWWKIF